MAATKKRRKPVSEPLKHGFLTHQDAIWSAIRELRENFTRDDIVSKTDACRDTVRDYLAGLVIAGYIERLGRAKRVFVAGAARIPTAYTPYLYALNKDTGVEAPRVRRDGSPVTQGLARRNMWRTIRIIKRFTIRHLAVHASTKETPIKDSYAKDYIKYLKAAGYVRVTQKRAPGRSTVYQFVEAMYTGPLAPQVQNIKQVFDANLGKVVWPRGEQS